MKNYLIITGCYGAGKTTLKKRLSKYLNEPNIAKEYFDRVEITEPDCWDKIIEYAKNNDVSIVETHINYQGKKPKEFVEIDKEKVVMPPKNVKIVYKIPDIEIIKDHLKKRGNRISETSINNHIYRYEQLAKILKGKVIK